MVSLSHATSSSYVASGILRLFVPRRCSTLLFAHLVSPKHFLLHSEIIGCTTLRYFVDLFSFPATTLPVLCFKTIKIYGIFLKYGGDQNCYLDEKCKLQVCFILLLHLILGQKQRLLGYKINRGD